MSYNTETEGNMRDKIITNDAWQLAKGQARQALVEVARAQSWIPYGRLVEHVTAIEFEPHEQLFFRLLGEISSEEYQAGRGMLTALVVHKSGDMAPGPGFYECARSLGLDVSDTDLCWVEQFRRVHATWRSAPPST